MTEMTPSAEDQIEKCDDEFGDSPSYWYGLMSMGFQNQRFCESIIDRAVCYGMRAAKKARDFEEAQYRRSKNE